MIQNYSDLVETRLRVLAHDLRGEIESVVIAACLTVAGATLDKRIKASTIPAPEEVVVLVELIHIVLDKLAASANAPVRES